MKYEWDSIKSAANVAKHGVSFDEAIVAFDDLMLTFDDDRRDYGEQREISIGVIARAVIVTIVHTTREGRIRIISARPANRKEKALYHAYCAQEY